MCGILVHDGTGNNFFVQKRGQDLTHTEVVNGIHFTHNLLHITGEVTPQPFIDGDIVCLYNGEIYNYQFAKSDGENIIPLYKEHGIVFPQFLDGEYAIVLFDFKLGIALYCTDAFGTKPLWRNGLYASSYESGVGGHKIPARTVEVVSIANDWKVEHVQHSWFDFDSQVTNNYDKVLEALSEAIRKRAKHKCFIGLSSGYDSGVIACELDKQNVDFKAFMIKASEDVYTMHMRSRHLKNTQTVVEFDHDEMAKHLNDNGEDFNYDYWYGKTHMNGTYKNDWASRGLSYICKLGVNEGRKVYLSGTGADEILSDYSLIPAQSQFKGTFPNNLSEWTNFYNGCQYSYLGKEECVAGSWNIETRYPFLDKAFVQEFLWLTPELKNRHYKAPLYEYLTRNNFPFQENKKIGFCI
jgi:asparagine synthetase B (glutamine-hydrolysing)